MLDLHSCPCSGGTLDRLIQPAILSVLAKGPLHGYRVADEIGEHLSWGEQKPDLSGVYRFLRVMEEKGLVTSSWDVSQSGPARKCYAIADDGRHCLAQWIETLERYREGINGLLRVARAAVRGRETERT